MYIQTSMTYSIANDLACHVHVEESHTPTYDNFCETTEMFARYTDTNETLHKKTTDTHRFYAS